jgi:hypothetical protein
MEEWPRKSGGFLSGEISKWLADPDGIAPSENPENLTDGLRKAAERYSLLRRVKKLEGERTQKSEKRTQLTKREKRIWAVIQQGATGRQYCRELDNAGIAPRLNGAWKDCPSRKYQSAYLEGEPWRHRIQDEKFKVRRKAKLAELACE